MLSDEADLSRIRSSIRADLGRAGVRAADVFDCLVAVTEACSNAMRHGNADAVPLLSWRIEPESVRFCVQDFSPERWARTAHPSRSFSDANVGFDDRIGGFGLQLMRGLMDEVDIRVGSEGTVVELGKALR